ncbi:galactose oxidase, partial [Martensiomyces pterosporus]
MDSTTWTVAPTSVLGSVPAPREGHSASFIGRTMFVFGGELMDGRCDDNLYAYNMANYTWYKVPIQGNPLVGRKGHTTVSVGSKLYVFGGTVDGYYLQDLVSFDVRVAATQGARWSYIDYGTNVPPGRAGHSCSVYLNSIYLFGGMNRDECFNDLWAYNLEDQKWSKVTPHGATPPARYGHASAVVDDCIFIMGGRTLRGEPLNDFFAYKISLQRWYTF